MILSFHLTKKLINQSFHDLKLFEKHLHECNCQGSIVGLVAHEISRPCTACSHAHQFCSRSKSLFESITMPWCSIQRGSFWNSNLEKALLFKNQIAFVEIYEFIIYSKKKKKLYILSYICHAFGVHLNVILSINKCVRVYMLI